MFSISARKFFRRDANILRRLKARRQTQRKRWATRVRFAKGDRDLEHLDTFHRAIRPYLCLAQVFGLMPLANIRSSDPQVLQFRVCSAGFFCTALFLLLGSFKTWHVAMSLFEVGFTAKNMVVLIFFTSNMITCLNFVSFARRWTRIIVPWTCLDIMMLFPPYVQSKYTLRYKLRILGFCLGCLALVEHCLFYASRYYNYRMHILHCRPIGTQASFDSFMHTEFGDIFGVVHFKIFYVLFTLIFTGCFNFIWNFMDLFIMMISLGLAQRFQQFGARVSALMGRYVPDALWSDIRQDHIRLCELIELVDNNLANIILVSCLNNMYFICNQLLSIFTKLRYPINYIYFWYSLLFLLGRTTSVFLCASRIHDASLLPLQAVHMVPSEYWTEEVQRFMQQLSSEFVGLSGHRLFYLTRRSFFGLMATLITYEFMLLQLDAKNRKMALPDLCA
ncbi:gustatory receptor for sugar taste 61a [Scaptodrosophila lebanonensis]|uniref:Gustatory receptor n=1 Tax=Drosophila lebanonensis TaxID=7225 RepID=A0A6J2T5L0_DROLE|nr:gustatory receptor for sugar taste 61a [Scaptodrosophila lebanonensis]